MTSPIDFEALVDAAIDSLPESLLDRLDNVVIVIEDAPNPNDLAEMDAAPGDGTLRSVCWRTAQYAK